VDAISSRATAWLRLSSSRAMMTGGSVPVLVDDGIDDPLQAAFPVNG
jgi:hypothetical protein